ncbi:MAG: 2-dehydropantoate 2-reductase [Firmicutes bacterium]|jgi:2-dehydropantoate 2-reductase|nr:2-dehydropantoate 2-reductase [Bacillota bacterium]
MVVDEVENMKIAVIGAGAMGALYGSKLISSGQEVVLVDVWPEHIRAINEHGLKVEEETGDRKLVSIPAQFAEEVKEKKDLLIFFTKTMHTEKALASASHFIDPQSAVLILQNGLGNVEKFAGYFAPENTFVGITTFTSQILGPGHIKAGQAGSTTIMQLKSGKDDRAAILKRVLDAAGLNCVLKEDVFPAIWEKLAFNSAMNSLTAATRLNVGQLGRSAEAKKLAFQIIEEVLGVAEAKGLVVDKDRVKGLVIKDFESNQEHKPSMLQDVLAGRRTEIESINGAAVREAEKLGLSLPATEILYRLIKIIDQALC